MPLTPKKTKFRKAQRRRLRGNASRGATIVYGEFGVQVMETMYLTINQIEAARKALAHSLKRGGKIWVRVCADKPYSARPAETRMGGGKGAPVKFLAHLKAGHIIFEVAGINREQAVEAFRLVSHKLPVTIRMVEKT